MSEIIIMMISLIYANFSLSCVTLLLACIINLYNVIIYFLYNTIALFDITTNNEYYVIFKHF